MSEESRIPSDSSMSDFIPKFNNKLEMKDNDELSDVFWHPIWWIKDSVQ